MLLILMPRSGTISVAMKFQKARPRLTPWKQIMQNCVITWLAWQDHPDVSLAARMHSTVLSVYLSTATIIDNLKAASSRITLFTSWTSLTHQFRHSYRELSLRKVMKSAILFLVSLKVGSGSGQADNPIRPTWNRGTPDLPRHIIHSSDFNLWLAILAAGVSENAK